MVRPGTSVANFNPAAFAQDQQISLSYLEPLVRPDPETLRPTPWLAERWEWRNNGLELLLTLRENVLWHDGSPLQARDAAFSYQVYQEDVESPVAGLFGVVEAIEVISDLELLIRFRTRDANWLLNAATLPIFSWTQYGAYWDAMPVADQTLSRFDWSQSFPVGTGPWQVASWEDRRVAFKRFDGYWREAPWLDALVINVAPGTRERIEAFTEGASQVLWPIRQADFRALDNAEGVLHVTNAASVAFAAFNFANPEQPAGSLWTDLRVRQAVSLAIDRERYAREVFGGWIRWDAASAVAQPWANDPELVSPAFNPQAAAVLLTEAGWVDYDGDGVREDVNGWQLRPVAIMREDSRSELAGVLARVTRDLAAVGIALVVESLPAGEFSERWIDRRTYDLIAYAYDQLPGFTDFDLYGSAWDIRTNPAGWNPGGYANVDADAAIADFLNAVSVERQAIALRRLQRAVNDDQFGLWFGIPRDLVLVAPELAGFTPDIAWQTARTWDLWQEFDDGVGQP